MARPQQDPQIRRNEILDAAEILFHDRGYHKTMVSDIVKEIGAAQGTFYYYFSSKEEIIEGLIDRHLSKFKSKIEKIFFDININLIQKIDMIANIIYSTILYKNGLLLDFLYNDQYLHLMDKFFRQSKKLIAPYLLDIIKEGNADKIFHTPFPEVSVRFILSIIQCYAEAMYDKKSDTFLTQQMTLAKKLIENALGAEEGSLPISL